MPIRQIDYGSAEYRQMISLRDEILRKPLRLSFNEAELEKEKDDILIAAFDEHRILGCCLLTSVDKQTVRLRQMAVLNKLQRMGIGASLTYFAENIARDRGYLKIIMHARAVTKGFYERLGYKISGEQFIELNIPHYLMEKRLR